MRLFVAVVPPPVVVDHLSAALEPLRLRIEAERLRWVPAASWHLTLSFLGEVDDARRPQLDERLSRAARRNQPGRLRLRGGGRFGGRVLWVGVEGERETLVRTAASAAAAARRSGIPVEERRYRPHLTVGRAREPFDLRAEVAALRDYQGPDWTASEIALVRSRLGGGSGRAAAYDVLATWTLGRGPAAGR